MRFHTSSTKHLLRRLWNDSERVAQKNHQVGCKVSHTTGRIIPCLIRPCLCQRSQLAVQRVTKEDEAVMKEWLENYHPVSQRTARSETTKDKAGALPPAVYCQAKQKEHSYVELNREQAILDDAATPTPITETTEQSEHSHGIDELQSVSLTFVNDRDVPEVQIQEIQQLDEYETDSDAESDEEGDFEVVSKTCTTRSERAVRAFVRLDL